MIHIDQFSFGKIVVNEIPYNSDIKIIDGNVISSWWRRAGHRVDIEDVKDILASTPDILVIGRGNPGLMKATDNLRKRIQKDGILLVEKDTSQAIASFNRLTEEGKNVAGCFHVGC